MKIIVDTEDITFCFTDNNVSRVECFGSFNNETYILNIYAQKDPDIFIQLVLGFNNDTDT